MDDFYIDQEDIVRWKSNDHIPFDDKLSLFQYEGRISAYQKVKSSEQREVESSLIIQQYIEAQKNHVPSDEELYEMRAAFGPGATVVDVISGRKIKL